MDVNKLIEKYVDTFNEGIPSFLVPNEILESEEKYSNLLSNCLKEKKTIKQYLNIDYKPNTQY